MEQHENEPYHAINVTISLPEDQSSITLEGDISKAYPEDAKIDHWTRKIHFDRNANELSIQEDYQLEQHLANHKLNFVTVSNMKLDRTDHGLILTNDHVNVLMQFDWKLFDFETEIKSLDNDHHLTSVWGETVQKFSLISKSQSNSDSMKIVLKSHN